MCKTCSTLKEEYIVLCWFDKFKHMNASMAGNTSTQRYWPFMLQHGGRGGNDERAIMAAKRHCMTLFTFLVNLFTHSSQ